MTDSTKYSTSSPSAGRRHPVRFYPADEERLNVLTHAFGFVASIVGTVLLVQKGNEIQDSRYLISYTIYGLCMMALFAASTIYHSATTVQRRRLLNIVDHSSIYLMIAGSYTPFTVLVLPSAIGQPILIAVWKLALFGVVLKLFFTGRYDRLSTVTYVLLGWIILLVINPIIEALPTAALILFFSGGILYSIGALFYSLKSLRYSHVTFHVFVLAASLCHYLAIYLYV